LLIGDVGLRAGALENASRIAQKLNCAIMAPMSNKRVERGAGRVAIDRVPYPVDIAEERLKDYRRIVLVGAKPPVAFFGYPNKPSALTHPDADFFTLAETGDDLADALERLCDHVGAGAEKPVLNAHMEKTLPSGGALTPDVIGPILGQLLPEGAVVCDESVSTGRNFFSSTHSAPPHDWLSITGGAIGCGIPLATGAAVGAPGRKIVNLQADGSAMYTLQALWTQARENLNILTLIWANHAYAILRGELMNVGAENPGRKAHDMLSLDDPALDWVALAKGMGVEAVAVEDVDALIRAMRAGLAINGPYLIEVRI
ncbi:MAG: acetolactate synthase large subunit, partial [Beijerinckiaceae bacterium]